MKALFHVPAQIWTQEVTSENGLNYFSIPRCCCQGGDALLEPMSDLGKIWKKFVNEGWKPHKNFKYKLNLETHDDDDDADASRAITLIGFYSPSDL